MLVSSVGRLNRENGRSWSAFSLWMVISENRAHIARNRRLEVKTVEGADAPELERS